MKRLWSYEAIPNIRIAEHWTWTAECHKYANNQNLWRTIYPVLIRYGLVQFSVWLKMNGVQAWASKIVLDCGKIGDIVWFDNICNNFSFYSFSIFENAKNILTSTVGKMCVWVCVCLRVCFLILRFPTVFLMVVFFSGLSVHFHRFPLVVVAAIVSVCAHI